MNLTDRDKRAIKFLGFSVIPSLALLLWPSSDSTPTTAASSTAILADTPDALERQLLNLRKKQAELPAKEGAAKDLQEQLSAREKGLIVADTLPQAQAQLAQIVRQAGRAQTIDFRALSMGQPRMLGDKNNEYGEILISATAECRIEQIVNLLADISKAPELIATEDLRIMNTGSKEKTLNLQITFSRFCSSLLRHLTDCSTCRRNRLIADTNWGLFSSSSGFCRSSTSTSHITM